MVLSLDPVVGSKEVMESSSSKRRRLSEERCRHCAEKKHLYLVVDDWKASPEPGAPMAFTSLGTSILVATNPHCSRDRAPPSLVYDAGTAALTVGPPPPDGYVRDAMAVGGKLYALLTVVCDDDDSHQYSTLRMQVLSWAPTTHQQEPWHPAMAWSWDAAPALPPFGHETSITSYALHPDGCTRDLGEWTLPFLGQAYFDAELDAWVGLHHKEDGRVCCCSVASRSAATARQPECRVLKEKLFCRRGEEKYPDGRYLSATLTYMGGGRFCLVENVLRGRHVPDAKGELATTISRTTRSYAVSKNTKLFSHAAFWM
ncbi:hypothetical protein GQ55_9G229500 [Panicum hallii var. hallii]|uniref:Uncharacterized protein n=1 Tax=Panicum hallii var. hallii TaxID=1504633 RepID=A0A2T7C686_9POAL|nr:hypothetical protein GQ55_9G229500 [Panicum hallii var. hallii]